MALFLTRGACERLGAAKKPSYQLLLFLSWNKGGGGGERNPWAPFIGPEQSPVWPLHKEELYLRPKGTGFRLAIADDEGQGSVLNVSRFMNSRSFQALRGWATGYLNDSAAAHCQNRQEAGRVWKRKEQTPFLSCQGPHYPALVQGGKTTHTCCCFYSSERTMDKSLRFCSANGSSFSRLPAQGAFLWQKGLLRFETVPYTAGQLDTYWNGIIISPSLCIYHI